MNVKNTKYMELGLQTGSPVSVISCHEEREKPHNASTNGFGSN